MEVKTRVKSFPSYFEKYLKKWRHHPNGHPPVITEILGVRIVCPFLEDLDRAADFVRDHFVVLEEVRKGAYNQHNVREFGYEGLHFVVQVPEDIQRLCPVDQRFPDEIQVRTVLQDAWAEVEHELIYKSPLGPLDLPLKRKLAALNANLTLADIVFQEIRDYQQQLSRQAWVRRREFLDHVRNNGTEVYHDRESARNERHSGGSLEQQLLEGLSAHDRRDYRTAITVYTRLLKRAPRGHFRALVLLHRAMAYHEMDLPENALEDLQEAEAEEPQNYRHPLYLGLVHESLGKVQEALQDYERCLNLMPYQEEALLAKARCLVRLGHSEEAWRCCQTVLKICPDSKEAQALARELESTLDGRLRLDQA